MTTPNRLSRDTSSAAEEVMLEVYRRQSPGEKLRIVEDAIRASRQLALAGLRSRHPEETPARLRRRLLDLVLGPELAARAYGPLDPE